MPKATETPVKPRLDENTHVVNKPTVSTHDNKTQKNLLSKIIYFKITALFGNTLITQRSYAKVLSGGQCH